MTDRVRNKYNIPNQAVKSSARLNKLEKRLKNKELAYSKPFICYLLIDCSDSMSGSKLSQAKSGAIDFSAGALKSGYKIGIITFSSVAIKLTDPLVNIRKLHPFFNKIVSEGSTNLSSALKLANEEIHDFHKNNVVVIVTDGMPNDTEKAIKSANELKSKGIEIIAIGTHDADKPFLKKIASSEKLAVPAIQNQLACKINSSTKLLP